MIAAIKAWLSTYALWLSVGAIAAVGAFAGLQTLRLAWAKADLATAVTAKATLETAIATAAQNAEAKARATEQRQADAIAAADIHYQREKADAIDVEKRVADGLRAGTLSLRHKLAACSATSAVPTPASSASGTDDGAELRAAVAQSVAIGAGCDARIRALQAVLTADRQ